jgi:membrane protease YdiL (CAAX protease family)
MFLILFLWILAPISIYLGLIVFNNVALTFILFYGFICLIIPIIDLIIIQRKNIKDYFAFLGFKNIKETFLPSFIIGIFFYISIFVFFVLLQKYVLKIDQVQAILDNWNIDNKYIIPFLFTMIIANSVFEEIYWRGYIYKKLENIVSSTRVILLTSSFYASYHLITTINLFSLLYGIIFTCVVFGIGLFWGYMRKKYDSIYFPIISHLLADLGIMLIYLKYFGN